MPIRIKMGNSTASTPTANAYRKNGVKTAGPGVPCRVVTSRGALSPSICWARKPAIAWGIA